MSEKPILFSGPMVRAILEGRKTQTRRVIVFDREGPDQYQHEHVVSRASNEVDEFGRWTFFWDDEKHGSGEAARLRALCEPGDTLWVRETWQYANWTEDGYPYIGYRDGEQRLCEHFSEEWSERLENIWADLSREENYNIDGRAADHRWRPAIHMPRWASRIQLRVTAVRVERVQEISYEDAIAEGFGMPDMRFEPVGEGETWEQTARRLCWPQRSFAKLWDRINAKRGYGWAVNPWVWVYEFERCEAPRQAAGAGVFGR